MKKEAQLKNKVGKKEVKSFNKKMEKISKYPPQGPKYSIVKEYNWKAVS